MAHLRAIKPKGAFLGLTGTCEARVYSDVQMGRFRICGERVHAICGTCHLEYCREHCALSMFIVVFRGVRLVLCVVFGNMFFVVFGHARGPTHVVGLFRDAPQ